MLILFLKYTKFIGYFYQILRKNYLNLFLKIKIVRKIQVAI